MIAVDNGKKFSVEHCESDKINFSILSGGQAAQCGVWTIIGPEFHAFVQDKNEKGLKNILDRTPSIPIKRSRGVFWSPIIPLKGTNPKRVAPLVVMWESSTQDVLGAVPKQCLRKPALRKVRHWVWVTWK